ncbi:hypothetical protein ABPG75_005757 [Micractinium tetrahymenae]
MAARVPFTPHPKGCQPGTVHIAVEEWLLDESGSATKPPAGKVSTSLCAPHGQLLPRRQVPLALTQGQGGVPAGQNSVFQWWSVTMARDAANGFSMQSPPGCSAGELACKKLNRGSVRTAAACSNSGGKSAGASSTCQWTDRTSLNIAGVRDSGRAQVGVSTQVNTKPIYGGDSRAVRLVAGFHAGVADSSGGRCTTTDWKTDDGGCNMDHPAQHEVTANTWTNDIQYTNVRVTPIYHLAVGGLWRLSVWAARLKENPPVPQDAAPVSKHLVTIDPDFNRNNRGLVVTEGFGWAAGKLVTLDLPKLGVTPGWHQLVVQGKATDSNSKLTQTAQVGVHFEVVPPCPKSASPFMTHVLEDSAWQIMDPRLGTLELQSNAFGGSYDVWVLWVKRLNNRPSFIMVSFDLSYLDPSAIITSASLNLHVSFIEEAAQYGSAIPLVAYDASKTWRSTCQPNCPILLPDWAPCIAPVCPGAVQVGTGRLNGQQDWNRFVSINLRKEWVTRHVAEKKVLKIALTMPWTGDGGPFGDGYGGLYFRSQNFTGGGVAPPFLRLTAECS